MLYPEGTPTQPEIIAIALSKLNLGPSNIFADIGCGSGSVSIGAAHIVKHVYALDDRQVAIAATTRNIKEVGLANVSVLKGEASILLSDLEIDRAFVGGSRNIEKVLGILMKNVPRFVISAVRLETATLALAVMKENDCFREVLQIQLSRGSDLAGGTMLKPANPVFLIAGGSC